MIAFDRRRRLRRWRCTGRIEFVRLYRNGLRDVATRPHIHRRNSGNYTSGLNLYSQMIRTGAAFEPRVRTADMRTRHDIHQTNAERPEENPLHRFTRDMPLPHASPRREVKIAMRRAIPIPDANFTALQFPLASTSRFQYW